MAFLDISLNFTKSNDWDLGADLGASDAEYARDVITLPGDTQSWDDFGAGQDLVVAINVTESFASSGDPTCQFEVGLATNNAGGSFYSLGLSRAFTKAQLTAQGDTGILNPAVANLFMIPLKPLDLDLDNTPNGKFISLRAVNAVSTAFTAGKVQAWLTMSKGTGVQNLKHFHESGFTV